MYLKELLETLEEGIEGSAELDRVIWIAFGAQKREDGLPFFAGLLGIGSYSTSVADALAVAKAVLPPLTKITIETYVGGDHHHCEIESDDGDARADNAESPAIAVIIATLRMLLSTPSKGGDA